MRNDGGMLTRSHHRLPALVVGLTLLSALWFLVLGASSASAQPGDAVVLFTPVRGAITPVTADHLTDAVRTAEDRGAEALVVELDTPGGLVTSMRVIVQTFLNADVPIVVYVTPSGADAGSAGTFITLAAHVAVMSPATTIGAATPVDLGGGEVGDKIVNNAAAYAEAVAEARGRDVEFAIDSVREGRSITATEALEIGAVDLIAADRTGLLRELDGMRIELPGDRLVTLATATAAVEDLPLSWTRSILQKIADPNVAFLLLSLSTLAILYEIANPGVGAGGVTGAVALILGLYSLSVLPVNFAGVSLLVVAAVLFAVEVVVPGIGVAAGGGTIALALAGLFLFQEPTGIGIDLAVLVPTVLVTAGLATLIGVAASKTRGLDDHGPSDDLVGRTGRIRDVDGTRPRIQLDGTWWRVVPAAGMDIDDLADVEVQVLARDNLDLVVGPADSPPPRPHT